ncbi:MAG: ABC-F family ATP-binding cassette domain-containing protein [Dysgonamonadaceae bacterium]|jgi:ATP-binding cassette subfamily F protein uup|nr:ABC-F family ATP-binding cassette domain-containing protein [Dysgonamonadaceae bacterium]
MASYLQVDGLTKSFGDRLLFKDLSFGIDQRQRVGLIAGNGVGKTTLLNILAEKEDCDAGDIVYRRDLQVGYLEQNPHFPSELTVLQAVARSNNDADLLKAKQMLSLLKINHFEQKTEELSGGQLKRAALAHVLITEPDLLLLDEPTNHLDMEMTEWLEDYLIRSNLSLLMVTHDRYFLDRVCTEIIEIDNQQLYSYKGGYNNYLEKRQERIDDQNKDLARANNLFRKELDWMRRQPQARATKAKARIDTFHDLEKKVQQGRSTQNIRLDVKASYIGNKIFEAKHISKKFGPIKIVEDFNYVFSRYEKLGIVGANGTGKSTFIKMLLGKIDSDQGKFDIGETVRFGYYSQDGLQFDENKTVIDVVQDIAEVIDLGDGRKLTASQFLQYFLFTPEKQYNFVHKLSGGEKRRLYLCSVLIGNPNFLVLDEPTNDLDIITLNVLEEYLSAFKGCVIVVSHDRYFMDKVVDHLLVFKGEAEIKDFPGNYTQYRSAVNKEPALKSKESSGANKKQSPTLDSRTSAENKKQKLSFNEKRELEVLEKEIPALEVEQTQLETQLSSGTLLTNELLAKSQRISQIIDELDAKMIRWMELSEKNQQATKL